MAEFGPRHDPTGMWMPGARPVTPEEWRRKRIAINVSLLWLAFPILDLLGSDAGTLRTIAVLAAAAGFVALYNFLPRGPGDCEIDRGVVLSLGAMLLIAGVLTVADRASWALLFVFAAIGGAMRLSPRAGALWIFACTALTAGTLLATHSDPGTAASVTATTLGIGFMMFAFRRLIRLNHELVEAREELARLAVSEERARFARDLHDLLGHSLSVIALKAELAERLIERDPKRAAEHVADVRDVARGALAEVRDTVSGYRRPTLSSELEGARMALEAAGIEAELEAAAVDLPADVEAVLAWAVREGTTNTVRHSGARSCRIAVRPGVDDVSAEIVDDGAGLPAAGAGNGSGNGLAGLRERAARVAGRVEAGPAPEGGFRLRVTVPRPAATT
jgi:two-component system sensor histidine kinase DesK